MNPESIIHLSIQPTNLLFTFPQPSSCFLVFPSWFPQDDVTVINKLYLFQYNLPCLRVWCFCAVSESTNQACETWTPYCRDIKRLDRFQQYKMRQILKISVKTSSPTGPEPSLATQRWSHHHPSSSPLGRQHPTYGPLPTPQDHALWGTWHRNKTQTRTKWQPQRPAKKHSCPN